MRVWCTCGVRVAFVCGVRVWCACVVRVCGARVWCACMSVCAHDGDKLGCANARVFIFIHAHVCAHLRVSASVCVHVTVPECVRKRLRICMHAKVRVCKRGYKRCVVACARLNARAQMCVRACECVRVYIDTCAWASRARVCVCVCVCMCVCRCARTNMCMCERAHMCVCLCVYQCVSPCNSKKSKKPPKKKLKTF